MKTRTGDRCPHCHGAINPAAMLAQHKTGIKMTLSDEERKRRSERARHARECKAKQNIGAWIDAN